MLIQSNALIRLEVPGFTSLYNESNLHFISGEWASSICGWATRCWWGVLYCTAVTVICHVPLCWLIIDKLQVGFKDATVALNISLAINLGLLFAFLKFSSRFDKTFISLSWEAFQNFGDFFRLAIPSAIMMQYELPSIWSCKFSVFV